MADEKKSWPTPLPSTERKKDTMTNTTKNKLHLDKANGKLMGVCSGLANWTGMDANLLRIIFVLATIFGFGSAILIYLAIGLIVD
ncbi:PspC domain-containing protein [Parasphingorhabdus halotolerans]|uniref:PspC domain-containing protein n=1 Tax=Parasphingorhabdus halotolerans TaxID=2725558 RepID=A0A6H2DKQ8_9SPHN|nr:PspC domain-containing protein [Parasphingorhabdus halotolerans]QJB69249.1 PspC domain-containing protein [Parasphingorhabdus halotolerans]